MLNNITSCKLIINEISTVLLDTKFFISKKLQMFSKLHLSLNQSKQ